MNVNSVKEVHSQKIKKTISMEKAKVKIIPIEKNVNKTSYQKPQSESFPVPSEWDYSKGDYFVKETAKMKKNRNYNNRLGMRVIKYSIYFAVAFSLIVTFILLNAIAEV